MSQNLAQRIGQEFKTLRANELSLKADSSAVNDALNTKVDIDTLSNMFELVNGEIVFKGNLVSGLGQSSITTKNIDISGALNVGSGVAGDILYHNGTSYVKLPKGTDGQVLTIVNGLPVWRNHTIG